MNQNIPQLPYDVMLVIASYIKDYRTRRAFYEMLKMDDRCISRYFRRENELWLSQPYNEQTWNSWEKFRQLELGPPYGLVPNEERIAIMDGTPCNGISALCFVVNDFESLTDHFRHQFGLFSRCLDIDPLTPELNEYLRQPMMNFATLMAGTIDNINELLEVLNPIVDQAVAKTESLRRKDKDSKTVWSRDVRGLGHR